MGSNEAHTQVGSHESEVVVSENECTECNCLEGSVRKSYSPICGGNISIQLELSELLRMPDDGLSSNVTCMCSPPGRTVIITSWDKCSMGRREFKCGRSNTNRCGMRGVFADPPICARGTHVIHHMYDCIQQLLGDRMSILSRLNDLEDENARLEAHINSIMHLDGT